MSDSWYPDAIRKEITKFARAISAATASCVGHVAVSEAASLFGYFSGAQVCSTWYIRRSTPDQLTAGGMADIEQYVPCDRVAPANYEGNSHRWSFESQGGVSDAQGEPWDAGQVRRAAHLLAWLNQAHQMPLQAMSSSQASQRGFGPHRLGIDPWRVADGERWSTSRGKVCPGDAKIAQVVEILALARVLAGQPLEVSNPVPQGNGGSVKNWAGRGDSGPLVLELQNLLRAAGWDLAADASFGPATETAVRQYQGSRGLVVDGLAGPSTLGALRTGAPSIVVQAADPVLTRGSTGDAVARLQRFLGITDDGSFGPATDAAVRAYQSGVGLTADGSVGPQTWAKINAGARPAAPDPAPFPVLTRGAHGEAVIALQTRLRESFPAYAGRLVADGSFGPATEAVVREFQARSGLVPDGSVGPLTRAALGL